MRNADEAGPEKEFRTAEETEANLDAWFAHKEGGLPEVGTVMDVRAAAFDAGWFAARKFFERDATDEEKDEPRVVDGGGITLQPLNLREREEVSRLQALDYAVRSSASDTPAAEVVAAAWEFFKFLQGEGEPE